MNNSTLESLLNSEFIDDKPKEEAKKIIKNILSEITNFESKNTTFPIILSIPILGHPLLKNTLFDKKPLLETISSEIKDYDKTTYNVLTKAVLKHIIKRELHNNSKPLTIEQLLNKTNEKIKNYNIETTNEISNALQNRTIYESMPKFYLITDKNNNEYLFAHNFKKVFTAIKKIERKENEILSRTLYSEKITEALKNEKKLLLNETNIIYRIEDEAKLLELTYIQKLLSLYLEYNNSLFEELTSTLKESIFAELLPRDFFRCMIINLGPENECLEWFNEYDKTYPFKISTLELFKKDSYYLDKNRKNKGKPQGLQLQFITNEISPKPIEIYMLSFDDYIKYFFTETAHRIYEVRREQK